MGYISNVYPCMMHKVSQVVITNGHFKDFLVWDHSSTNYLFLNEVYYFKTLMFITSRGKLIWNQHIPPSKSLISWRLMHNYYYCICYFLIICFTSNKLALMAILIVKDTLV